MPNTMIPKPLSKPHIQAIFRDKASLDDEVLDLKGEDTLSLQIDELLGEFNGRKIYAKSMMAECAPLGFPLESDVLRQIIDEEDPDMPIMMVNIERIINQWNRWKRLIPRAQPFYPVKCNDDPLLLRTLFKLGAGFDCASPAEMRTILSMGCPPEDIIYSNPCKQVSSLQFARSRGVLFTVFDNIDELFKVAEYMPEAKLLLRITTNDKDSQCPMSAKFGATREMWPELIETAKNLNLCLIGVHFHAGSGCSSVRVYAGALRDAADIFDMANQVGFEMTVLDIGGGFPGDDQAGCSITIESIAQEITPLMDTLFPSNVLVISEPGRYFAASSHTLAVKVFSRRAPSEMTMQQRSLADAGGSQKNIPNMLYYINDGLYGSFNCVLYDHATIKPEILKSQRNELGGMKKAGCENEVFPSTIFGQTCDGFDCIISSVLLPKLEIGDWLVFRSMGAYTVAAASTFNGFSKPHTRYVRILDNQGD